MEMINTESLYPGIFSSQNLKLLAASSVRGASVNFTDVFESSWAPDHIAVVGDQVTLTLDTSGCGFKSKIKYLFGKASAQIKLVEGDSAGTVIAFYMSSRANHDRLGL
ncbi:hypothetical protein HAX54_025870 [Datura stramonium]|uniref:GH16 domain-containing protein n=1 Tax=Datura stramonium TaxID=4076 RepID=A0ABS8V0K0_DATST|nr:hypothetical protein [Datura stramonium]